MGETPQQPPQGIDAQGSQIGVMGDGAHIEGGIHFHAPSPRLPLHRPPRAQHFTGRQAELAQLLGNLYPGHIVTLCGPGGIGKTALAAEALWTLAPGDEPPDRFPDGIILHNFYTQPQAAIALEAIARAYSEEPRPTPTAAAQRALAGRTALLVLDGAENADDLQAVLDVRDRCGVLITSRSREDVREIRQEIEPLPNPEAVALLQAWGLERAADEDAARRICTLVGALPLAVRLVGRYLVQREEEAADYLVWLERTPLEALRFGQRQRDSVPVLLDKSVALLSETARRALGVVGVLALSPFGREAVAAALEVEPAEVGRSLGELVNYGLLLRDDERYQVSHALVHTYSRERLKAMDDTLEQLTVYFTKLVVEQNRLKGTDYKALDPERPHLGLILKHHVDSGRLETVIQGVLSGRHFGNQLELLYELQLELNQYYDRSGRWVEHQLMLEEAVEDLEIVMRKLRDLPQDDEALSLLNSDVRHNLGCFEIQLADIIRRQLNELDSALELCHTGKERVNPEKLRPPLSEAEVYLKLGDIYRARGEFREALKQYKVAKTKLVKLPRETRISVHGKLLSSVADGYGRSGINLELALRKGRESLELHKKGEDEYEIVQSHRILADVHLARGEVGKAAFHVREACEILKKAGQELNPIMGWSLRTQGDVFLWQGDVLSARDYYEQALEVFDKRHVGIGVAVVKKKLGLWELRHGNILLALQQLNETVEEAKTIKGGQYIRAETLLSRIEAGFAAKELLDRYYGYQQGDLKKLETFIENDAEYHNDFIQLVQDSDDLAALMAYFELTRKRFEIKVGTATSVSKSLGFDPFDALAYAVKHDFYMLQVFLDHWTADTDGRKKLVDEAQRNGIRLMCHAPGLLNQDPITHIDIIGDAHAVLKNTLEKWVVFHFDEKAPLDVAFSRAKEMAQAGLVPCIENYHQLNGPEHAKKNYALYLKLFDRIAEAGFSAYAVLDLPRLFNVRLGLDDDEACKLTINAARRMAKSNIPILLHLVDTRTSEQDREDYCPLGAGVIPFSRLLRELFASEAHIEAAIFEFEDKQNPLESRSFLEECIRDGVAENHPRLSVRWIG